MAKRGVRSNRSTTVALLDKLSDRFPAETIADLIDAALALAASNLDGLVPLLEQVPERARRGGRPRIGSGRTGQHKYTIDLVDQDFERARRIELMTCATTSENNINVIIEGAMRLGLHMMVQPPEDLAQSMFEQEKKRRQEIKWYYASRALRNCGKETTVRRADEILVGDIEAVADRQQQ